MITNEFKTDEYKGFTYLIIIHPEGHFCGYVNIPSTHIFHTMDMDQIASLVKVHGRITYWEDGWLGFDTNHYSDILITPKYVIYECRRMIEQIIG